MTDAFHPFETKMRAAGLPSLAVETFRRYWQELADGGTGMLSRDEIAPVTDLPHASELTSWAKRGAEELRRTVVIKLNGGLGTSMGMTRAKALLPVREGTTFLDFIARQVLWLRREHGCALPLVLMNSFRTRADSLEALAHHDGLDVGLPLDFVQHKVPKVCADDLSPLAWPADPEIEWCPPGHGDIYAAMVTSGLLETLRERGFEHAFVSNSDNLGAVPDVAILGWFAAERIPFLMEVADRTEADRKGGHLAVREDGQLVLREVAQCPPEELASFQNIRLYRYFNTNSLWVSLPALESALRRRDGVLGLPLIRNRKPADPTDESSPPVYQLETAMGAAISVFDGARALRVGRERFLPVKTTNDLLVVRSDVYTTTPDHRVVPTSGRAVGDLLVELDPAHYRRIDQLEERFPRGAPSLARCRRLIVRGDVRFGAGVVCRGEVCLEHVGAEPLQIPDEEILG